MAGSDKFLEALHEWTGISMRNSMHDFLRFSREKGMSLSQIGALFRIRRGGCSVSDISGELGITAAAASQMLDSLAQQDFIRRSEDPNDRRVRQIVLTEKGRKVLLESIHTRQRWMHSLVNQLNGQEQLQVASALELLVEKAKQLEKKDRPTS
jgi:DNA-binding MarR family transcriptional regulator